MRLRSIALKVLLPAGAILFGMTAASLAQSTPNFGPNAPSVGDSFGKPYSGARPLPSGARAYHWRRAHAYAPPRHHRAAKHRAYKHRASKPRVYYRD